MSWSDWAKLGAELWSSNQANKGNKDAANAVQAGQQSGIDEQRRQFDLTRQDMAPWLSAGTDALGKQTAFLNGDWSGFQNSPDYKYALSQGLDSIDHRAAARGGLFGGGNTRDAMTFGSGLATKNADGYWNKIAGMSGTGNASAANLGSLGASMANGISGAYSNMGNARASSYFNRGYNNAAAGSNLANIFQNWGSRDSGDIY
jgi:hypothetical protein